METNKVILQGGGEHARVVLDILLASKIEVIGIFDPKYSGHLMGVRQFGEYDPTFEPTAKAVVAIGSNNIRKMVVAKTAHRFTTVIHHSALVSKYATIGDGTMLLHAVIVQAFAHIGSHVILNTGSQIDHDCKIGDYVHIAPGATLCGTVTIEEGAFIGAGAVVVPGIKIGKWSTIGAGAVVVKDIPEYAVAVGNPARIIKYHHT